MSLLHREASAFKVGTDGDIEPLVGGTVTAYDVGGVVSEGSTDSTVPVFAGHGFEVGDKFIVNFDITKYREVTTAEATSLTVNNGIGDVVVVAGDILINLGPDPGPTEPFYTGSTVEIYAVPDTGTPIDDSEVDIAATGDYDYYHNSDVSNWELIRNSAGTPVGVAILNSQVLLTPSGSPFVDNAIARWDGTAGLLIQSAYTSNTPTITDAGGITAAGTHTLGRSGATLTAPGALSVGEASTLTGVVTAPAANVLGTTDNTQTVNGSVAIAQGLTVGTSASVATTLDVNGDTTLAKTTTGQLNASDGSAPTVAIGAGWGSGGGVGASIASGGRDNRFTINVVAGSSSLATNATITVTFNGTFAAALPIAIVALNTNASSQGVGVGLSWTVNPTTLSITYRGTPTAAGTYRFDVIVLG